jgi:DNA repair protein RadC
MKNIANWAMDDRPREKMLTQGIRQLTDSELLAIILGSGTIQMNAVELGRQLLGAEPAGLLRLSKLTFEELQQVKGIGQAKATKLLSLFELSRRMDSVHEEVIKTIKSSHDAYGLVRRHLSGLSHEEFYVILLNRGNKVLSVEQISSGGLSGTVADGKIIYRKALLKESSALILAHNHPSGNLKPSQADLNLTKKLKEFGEMVGFQVLDHLIISDNGYLSFADEGLI